MMIRAVDPVYFIAARLNGRYGAQAADYARLAHDRAKRAGRPDRARDWRAVANCLRHTRNFTGRYLDIRV